MQCGCVLAELRLTLTHGPAAAACQFFGLQLSDSQGAPYDSNKPSIAETMDRSIDNVV